MGIGAGRAVAHRTDVLQLLRKGMPSNLEYSSYLHRTVRLLWTCMLEC